MSNLNAAYIDDGIGVINNRGESKYWGITRSTAQNGGWCVSYTPKGADKTKTLYFRTRMLNERVAARIAREIYFIDRGEGYKHSTIIVHTPELGNFKVDFMRNRIFEVVKSESTLPIDFEEDTAVTSTKSKPDVRTGLPTDSESWSEDEIYMLQDLIDMKLSVTRKSFWEMVEKISKL